MTTDLHPFSNPGRTKLALVSRGLALPDGLADASRYIAQANAAESVLDVRLPSGQFCTVPIAQPYTEASGFSLSLEDGKAELRCGGEVQPVQLLEAPRFYRSQTRSGARMGSFASLHDRLLMLHPLMGCGFFAQKGMACGYCQYDSMLNQEEPPMRDPLELVEVMRAALAERDVDTVYLYNGASPGDDAGLSRLIPVIALLRKHLGHQQIALETVAPRNLEIIDDLYAAGLDIFVCNLEVHDSGRFAEVCPGKQRDGGQDAVWKALDHACTVFRPGSVVSHLIVGLEPLASTLEGMQKLVACGIVPLLTPFRPLPGTPLADQPLPSLDDVEQALLHQYELLSASQLPSNRLRDMGRVLTPMESGALVGRETMLHERIATSSMGRKIHGWLDALRRYLRVSGDGAETNIHAMDKRPIHVLMARRSLPLISLLILGTVAGLTMLQTPPDGLSIPGWRALIVFALCLILWVSQLLPLPITSVLGLALLPVLGVMPAGDIYSLFGNPAVFFILGAFALAAGIIRSGLSEQLALSVLGHMGTSPRRLMLTVLLLPALMACFMPEHAVVAVMLPIVWSLVRGLDLPKGHSFTSGLFFALAWGAIIGGVLTLLGGARGPLALGILQETTGQTFTFSQWTLASAPIVFGMLTIAAALLFSFVDFSSVDLKGAVQRIDQKRLEIGRASWSARLMAMLMLVTMLGWIFFGETLGLAAIALLAVVAMFALRITIWPDVQSHIDWGVILMYGGAIAIAKALEMTGAAGWMAHLLWPDNLSGWGLLVLLGLMTLLLTEGISNTAAVAIMLPLAISMASSAHLDPVLIAMGIGIVSGFAFMLPMGTPANAMIYGTGYIELGRMVRLGLVLMLSALVLFSLVTRMWWPVLEIGVGL
ncbi:MAG: DASS family sodium-coupled anion symporter [Mariprofundaceae bacterium]|nr:DASS family sodium-coupled anion symporter [Mariprofundaceae bacterium]